MSDKPKLAMISTDIRRDLVSPIEYFTKLEVIHFYQNAPYFDLYPSDFKGNLVRYRTMLDLCNKIKKCGPTIIQGSEPYGFPKTFQACAASYLMSKILDVPMFFPMLENRPPQMKYGTISPFLMAYLKIYAQWAKLIFCLNEGAKRNLLNIGIDEGKLKKRMWGTWGVDVEEFTPEKDGKEPALGRFLLFVGRLDESKGIRYLLPAFKRVKEKIRDVNLVLIGDGPLREEILQFSKQDILKGSISLFGILKNRDLPPYFRAASLTVTPSITTRKWEEQIGMVNIQSMACGTPVVSTLSGAIPEFVKDEETGLLVLERDSDELAGAIIRLLTDDDLRIKLGKNARKHAVDNLDAKKNVEANEKIILSLLGEI